MVMTCDLSTGEREGQEDQECKVMSGYIVQGQPGLHDEKTKEGEGTGMGSDFYVRDEGRASSGDVESKW